MNTILVPLDGSPLAEQVLPYVQRLASLMDANLHLVRVLWDAGHERTVAEIAAAPYSIGEALSTDSERERYEQSEQRQRAEGYLLSETVALRRSGLDVTTDVTVGPPADSILDVAERKHAALIAMATHGYSGLRRWMVGSIADKVVHAASCPVFIVRSTAALPGAWGINRVLVPLDGSALARAALPLALTLAQRAQAELVLFQAVTPLLGFYTGPYAVPAELEAAQLDLVQQSLRTLAGELRVYEVPITVAATVGYAAEAIVDEATRRRVDLIVMATHGYSGLRRWVLGSVADKVLHATTTPLLLVRPAAEPVDTTR